MWSREQLQAAYDSVGSVERLGNVLGCSRSHAWTLCHRAGVKLKPRAAVNTWAGRSEKPAKYQRTGKRVVVSREMCPSYQRPCVLHDFPGSCTACAVRRELTGGIVSTLSVEGLRR